jgi:hypothetical protein
MVAFEAFAHFSTFLVLPNECGSAYLCKPYVTEKTGIFVHGDVKNKNPLIDEPVRHRLNLLGTDRDSNYDRVF